MMRKGHHIAIRNSFYVSSFFLFTLSYISMYAKTSNCNIRTRNVTVCNRSPRRSLVRDTPSHYALSFCDVSFNLLQ